MNNCDVVDAQNLGAAGSTVCGNYDKSHPMATLTGYGGANVRGFSFAGSHNAHVYQCRAHKLESSNGESIGFDVHTDSSNIEINRCEQTNVKGALSGYGLRFTEGTTGNKLMRRCFLAPVRRFSSIGGRHYDIGTHNYVMDKGDFCNWDY